MRRAALTLALTLLAAPTAAMPITAGTWQALPLPNNDGVPFVDHVSWDGAMAGMAWVVAPGSELLVGGFGFDGLAESDIVYVGGVSDYRADGLLTYDGHSFSYSNGHGFASSSLAGTHQALTRRVFPTLTQYDLWIEDLPAGDFDFQDAHYTFAEHGAPLTVPEPTALALLGLGLSLVARRLR